MDKVIDHISEEQLAKLMGISVATLRNRIAQGRDHPPFIKYGRTKVFPVDELVKWEKKRLVFERIRRVAR